MVSLTEHQLKLLVAQGVLTEDLLEVESLKGDFSSVNQDERRKLFELDVLVIVGIIAEHVPENILQFILGRLVEHFLYQKLKFILLEVLALYVMHVQNSQVRPNILIEFLILRLGWLLFDKALPVNGIIPSLG